LIKNFTIIFVTPYLISGMNNWNIREYVRYHVHYTTTIKKFNGLNLMQRHIFLNRSPQYNYIRISLRLKTIPFYIPIDRVTMNSCVQLTNSSRK
jgi:hypothetical protein